MPPRRTKHLPEEDVTPPEDFVPDGESVDEEEPADPGDRPVHGFSMGAFLKDEGSPAAGQALWGAGQDAKDPSKKRIDYEAPISTCGLDHCVAWRVQAENPNAGPGFGIADDVGTVPRFIGLGEFIRRFIELMPPAGSKTPAVFYVDPVDGGGNLINRKNRDGKPHDTVRIHPGHEVLARIREEMAAERRGEEARKAQSTGMDNPMMVMLMARLDAAEKRAADAQAALNAQLIAAAERRSSDEAMLGSSLSAAFGEVNKLGASAMEKAMDRQGRLADEGAGFVRTAAEQERLRLTAEIESTRTRAQSEMELLRLRLETEANAKIEEAKLKLAAEQSRIAAEVAKADRESRERIEMARLEAADRRAEEADRRARDDAKADLERAREDKRAAEEAVRQEAARIREENRETERRKEQATAMSREDARRDAHTELVLKLLTERIEAQRPEPVEPKPLGALGDLLTAVPLVLGTLGIEGSDVGAMIKGALSGGAARSTLETAIEEVGKTIRTIAENTGGGEDEEEEEEEEEEDEPEEERPARRTARRREPAPSTEKKPSPKDTAPLDLSRALGGGPGGNIRALPAPAALDVVAQFIDDGEKDDNWFSAAIKGGAELKAAYKERGSLLFSGYNLDGKVMAKILDVLGPVGEPVPVPVSTESATAGGGA